MSNVTGRRFLDVLVADRCSGRHTRASVYIEGRQRQSDFGSPASADCRVRFRSGSFTRFPPQDLPRRAVRVLSASIMVAWVGTSRI